MDGHVLQNDSTLQLSSSTLEGNFSYIPHLAEYTLHQQHFVKAEDCGSYSVPQWLGHQQVAPYHVEYLAGNGISDMQGEVLYDISGIGCSFAPAESFLSIDAHQIEPRWRLPKQGTDEGLDNAAQHQPNMSASTSGILTKSRKTNSRQKAADTDRRRRMRIGAALDALEELLPQSKQGNKTNIIDDCIDYIKYLQLHMKELSQSRLGGEPTSNHLTYLEGYGHYLVNEDTTSGPLQDLLGKLLEVNLSEATKLLDSLGLFMMPVAPK